MSKISNIIEQLTKPSPHEITDGEALNRILVVEDEIKILGHLTQTIAEEGYSTFTCTSYTELENLLKLPVKRFDVVVLDRLLNAKDSASLINQIKSVLPEVKILIVSAINTPTEKAALLDLGADDYLAKPFDSAELIARIRALLRRNLPEDRIGNLVLNSEKRSVTVDQKELSLQNKEFVLLRTLVQAPGKVFNKIYLYEHVWRVSTNVESNVVEATVNKLRRRLEEAGATCSIKSLRNKGYWIEE
jgi:DNA-binding response OmpR family regulator